MSCEFEIQQVNTKMIVFVFGEITRSYSSILSQFMTVVNNTDKSRVIIDLSQVIQMDSFGIGTLVYFWRELANEKRELIFRDPSQKIFTLLNRTGLDRIFKIVFTDTENFSSLLCA